jgi:hypothetical protein
MQKDAFLEKELLFYYGVHKSIETNLGLSQSKFARYIINKLGISSRKCASIPLTKQFVFTLLTKQKEELVRQVMQS